MSPQEAGAWVFIVVGAILVLATAIRRLDSVFTRLSFGVLSLGLGVFGLEFMDPYRQFLEALTNVLQTPTAENAATLLDEAANPRVPEEMRRLAAEVTLRADIPDARNLVEERATATPDATSRQIFEDAVRQYDVVIQNTEELARRLAAQRQLTPQTFEYLSPDSKLYLKRTVEAGRLDDVVTEESKQRILTMKPYERRREP